MGVSRESARLFTDPSLLSLADSATFGVCLRGSFCLEVLSRARGLNFGVLSTLCRCKSTR